MEQDHLADLDHPLQSVLRRRIEVVKLRRSSRQGNVARLSDVEAAVEIAVACRVATIGVTRQETRLVGRDVCLFVRRPLVTGAGDGHAVREEKAEEREVRYEKTTGAVFDFSTEPIDS